MLKPRNVLNMIFLLHEKDKITHLQTHKVSISHVLPLRTVCGVTTSFLPVLMYGFFSLSVLLCT